MIYEANIEHFSKFDFEKFKLAVRVTAATVAPWCRYYGDSRTSKPIPETGQAESITAILERDYFADPAFPEFTLFMDAQPVHKVRAARQVCIFDHHDDTDCWALNLLPEQYEQLQAEFRKNNLPNDLFIPTS